MVINKTHVKQSYITDFIAAFENLLIKVGGAYWPRQLLILFRSRPIGLSYR